MQTAFRYFCILLTCFTATFVSGQISEYPKQAEEAFRNGNYSYARDAMIRWTQSFDKAQTNASSTASFGQAQYIIAASSYELRHPDAKHDLSVYLSQYADHPKANYGKLYLGKLQFEEKEYEKARQTFKSVSTIELSRDDKAEFYFQNGYANFVDKKFGTASKYFQRVDNHPEYGPDATYYLGYIDFQKENYNQALKSFNQVKDIRRYGRVVPYYILAVLYIQGDFEGVISTVKEFDEVSKLRYSDQINQLVGKSLYELGQFKEALPYLEEYDQSARKMLAEDIFQIGYCYLKTDEFDLAADRFEELTVLEDTLGHYSLYLLGSALYKSDQKRDAKIAWLEGSNRTESVEALEQSLLNFGKVSIEEGNSTDAVQALQRFVNEFPKSQYRVEAQELLATELVNSRDYSAAYEILLDIPSKSPQVKRAFQVVTYYKGVELYNQKNLVDAAKFLNESLQYPVEPKLTALGNFWMGELDLYRKRYNSAIAYYSKFDDLSSRMENLPAQSSKPMSDYGKAYGYYRINRFGPALRYFEQAANGVKEFKRLAEYAAIYDRVYPDASLRAADCKFMLGKKEGALSSYKAYIRQGLPASDYAMYQSAMIDGLLERPNQKAERMMELAMKYPSSLYYERAKFQAANTYFLDDQFTKSVQIFEELLEERPNSSYTVQVYMKLALLYYNSNNDQKAIEYYQLVADQYPNTPEAKNALNQIKEISVQTGNVQWYIETVGASLSEVDTLTFNSAENAYLEGEYNRAIELFTDYIDQFAPTGYFSIPSYYYRGQSYYYTEVYDLALMDYENVLSDISKASPYLETTYLNAAEICRFKIQDDIKALEYYQKLLPYATTTEIRNTATEGALAMANKLNYFDETKVVAKQIIANPQSPNDLVLKAHSYWAKLAYERSYIDEAKEQFKILASKTENNLGIEARYYLNEIEVRKGKFEETIPAIDDFVKKYPSYEEFIVRSFILYGRIYFNTDELAQAKSTLESIVQNYDGNLEIVEEAEELLEEVKAKLQSNTRIESNEEDGSEE